LNLSERIKRIADAFPATTPSRGDYEFEIDPVAESPDWRDLARTSWERNARGRELLHALRPYARSLPTTQPAGAAVDAQTQFVIAYNCFDASLYAFSVGEERQALGLIDDLLFFGDLALSFESTGGGCRSPSRLSLAFREQALVRIHDLVTRTSDRIAANETGPVDPRAIVAADWARLYDVLGDESAIDRAASHVSVTDKPCSPDETPIAIVANHIRALQRTTRAAIAVWRFEHDNKRWPDRAVELLKAFPDALPSDPSGGDADRIRYCLIRNAKPLGVDRPLVAFKGGQGECDWSYRTDRPEYLSSSSDGSGRDVHTFTRLAQVRDVSWWRPKELPAVDGTPRTAKLRGERDE
jgi:hypothetical protein